MDSIPILSWSTFCVILVGCLILPSTYALVLTSFYSIISTADPCPELCLDVQPLEYILTGECQSLV